MRSLIETTAESINLPPENLESSISTIESRVEYETLATVSSALRYASASKRVRRLTANDVERAAKEKRAGPVVHMVGDSPQWLDAQGTQLTKGRVYFVGEPDVDLVADKPLGVRAPLAPSFAIKWIAHKGLPLVPAPAEQLALGKSPASSSSATSESVSATASTDITPPVVPAPLSKVSAHYLNDLIQVLTKHEEEETRSVFEANPKPSAARIALNKVSTDSGLDTIVPHLVRFISQRVAQNLHHLPALSTSVALAGALVANDRLTNLDLYLHELLPALLTTIVAKRLCQTAAEDHWTLREEASKVVARICERYDADYVDLRPRVAKTFLEAVSSEAMPLTSQYGGIMGLMELGSTAVDAVLIPALLGNEAYFSMLEAAFEAAPRDGAADLEARKIAARREEAGRVRYALRSALEAGAGASGYTRPRQRLLDRLGARERGPTPSSVGLELL